MCDGCHRARVPVVGVYRPDALDFVTVARISTSSRGRRDGAVETESRADRKNRTRQALLDATMDLLRDRFGRDSVTRAVLIGRNHGDDAPMLPD